MLPKRVLLGGDRQVAASHIGEADSLLNLVVSQAGFQKLKQYQMQRQLCDGTVIVASICFGQGTVQIWSPPRRVEMVREEERKEQCPAPWCCLVNLGQWDATEADVQAQELYDIFTQIDRGDGMGQGWQFPRSNTIVQPLIEEQGQASFKQQFRDWRECQVQWLAPGLLSKKPHQWEYFDVAKYVTPWEEPFNPLIPGSGSTVLGIQKEGLNYAASIEGNYIWPDIPETALLRITQRLQVTDTKITYDYYFEYLIIAQNDSLLNENDFHLEIARDDKNQWSKISGVTSATSAVNGQTVISRMGTVRTLPPVLLPLRPIVTSNWPLDTSSKPVEFLYVPFYETAGNTL